MSSRSQELTLYTAHPWVLSNTPAKCEVHRRNGCRENRQTDRQRLIPLWFDNLGIFLGNITQVSGTIFSSGLIHSWWSNDYLQQQDGVCLIE